MRFEQQLLLAAKEVMQHAYNIYSSFFVGAAVYTSGSNTYTGTNMENASFGLTVCAEIGALQAALSAADFKVEKMAIIGHGSKSGQHPVTPCGRCRQLIYEAGLISGKDIDIILSSGDMKQIVKTGISQLLPMPFGPDEKGMAEIEKRFRL